MKTKKSLGQHFLKSEKTLNSIVNAGEIKPTDTILEIGPGYGVLTEKLLTRGVKVIAVEKDDDLFKSLQNKFKKEISFNQLNLINGDILNFNISHYLPPTTYYKLIANIPYNITGAILKKFLETDQQPERVVLLVQREVANRIAKNHGRLASMIKESILSISVKVYGTPRYIETVKAGSFVPMPQVDSAIIAIENISKEFFHNIDEKKFFKMLRAGFGSKRKKLSSNLSTIFDKKIVASLFLKLNLNANIRAEDVPINTWRKLAQELCLQKIINKK